MVVALGAVMNPRTTILNIVVAAALIFVGVRAYSHGRTGRCVRRAIRIVAHRRERRGREACFGFRSQ
jgi:hypothetical protein